MADIPGASHTAAGPSAERTAGYVMPTPWEANLDPSDNVDFYADFGEPTSEGHAPVLTAGEIIASFTVIHTASANAAGLLIGDTGVRNRRVEGKSVAVSVETGGR